MMSDASSAFRIKHGGAISRAVALIRPRGERQHDACRDDIELAIFDAWFPLHALHAVDHPRTKPAKTAARRLARALRRVEVVLKDKTLDFPIEITASFPRDELLKWGLRCENLAKTPSGRLIRRKAEAKRLAVSEAHSLMSRHGTLDDATKGSRFCRLASLLYETTKADGWPDADLANQCRAFLRSKKRGPR
jgi:hypothetical protein